MAIKTFSITTERQNFGTGLLNGAKLVDPAKKRLLLQEYGFSDLEITIIIIEQDLITEQIKLNEQPIKRTRKRKEADRRLPEIETDSDDDLDPDGDDEEDDEDIDL